MLMRISRRLGGDPRQVNVSRVDRPEKRLIRISTLTWSRSRHFTTDSAPLRRRRERSMTHLSRREVFRAAAVTGIGLAAGTALGTGT
ncbi:hypothetical protein K7G98_18995, partial [Saccharothrix sp. MB29]|nr:hypothetical protein [Saccharothrix sp. MB29]